MEFLRTNDQEETGSGWAVIDETWNGLLFETRDTYGNRNEYSYPEGSGQLAGIALNANAGDDGGHAEAFVLFYWDGSSGRLNELKAYRYDAAGTPVETQSVSYTYMDETNQDYSPDLGADGDLIQVVQRERVDSDPGETDEAWRVRVTQYRYHGGDAASSGARDFDWQGSAHQLKMVIQPEQIEYYAQKRAAGSGGCSDLEGCAVGAPWYGR